MPQENGSTAGHLGTRDPCLMGAKYTELRCLAVAEAIERRLGPLTPIDPVTL